MLATCASGNAQEEAEFRKHLPADKYRSPATMTHHPQLPRCLPEPFSSSQKVQLTFKLLLLENARNTLDREVRSLTNEAYEEVQGFLNVSFPTNVFTDLLNSLDAKCQALNKLLAVLKDTTTEPQFHAPPTGENGVRTNQIQLRRYEGILATDVLKFGPMLQKVLTARSISKAIQVLGSTLSLRQLKQFIVSQPRAIQEYDAICSSSSSYDTVDPTASSSGNAEAEEQEHAVDFGEKRQPDAVIVPPAIIQSVTHNTEGPPPPPPLKAILSEISNPKPMITTPVISWGCENDVQVRHQKQTCAQLLHFLSTKAKDSRAEDITFAEWYNSFMSTQPTSPTIKTEQLTAVADDPMCFDALVPKSLLAGTENQPPVFRVKQVEPSGRLTYSCVIATETELWDIGNIFTEEGEEKPLEAGTLEKEECRNDSTFDSTVNLDSKTQSLSCAEENASVPGAKMSAINCLTIPEFRCRMFDEIEVVVSHVVSPGNFYIQHSDAITKLQALVTDTWKASSSYAEQNCIPDIGTPVMGRVPKQEQWCRAQVTKICGVSADNAIHGAGAETSIKVEVKRLDHGDTACLSLSDIKELLPEMAVLPLQAIQVSLANVTPMNGTDWSEEAVGWFRAAVRSRTFYARLNARGPKATVKLFFEKGKLGAMRRSASLSLRLAQNGHAKHDQVTNISGIKRSTSHRERTKQESDWENYLLSFYTQNKK